MYGNQTLKEDGVQLFLSDNRDKSVKQNLLDKVEELKREIESSDWTPKEGQEFVGFLVKVYARSVK